MAKTLLPNQCDLLHQYYPPNDCCLCKALSRIKELETELEKLKVREEENGKLGYN